MKTFLAIALVVLQSLSALSMAAEIDYQDPNDLTIVAVNETLDSVLKALGREMQITVTAPPGVNPVINCDIQNKTVKRAFKTLLGDLSYSLVWEDNGDRLAGLVILSGDGESAVVTAPSANAAPVAAVSAPVAMPVERRDYPETAMIGSQHDQYDYDSQRAQHEAEREAEMEAERLEREDRRAREREEERARKEQMRQEEALAHEARVKESAEQHDAWLADYLDTHGPKRP